MVELDPAARPLVLDPADLTTATYEQHPTIGIPRRHLSEREVVEVAARFELVTWPEREEVQTTPIYLDEANEPAAYSRIVLEPEHPLEEVRWYAIRARIDSADVPLEDVSPRDGEYSVSRFFLGPNPVIRRSHARARADGGGDVEIVFSERVRLDEDVFAVAIDGRPARCRVGNPTELFGDGANTVWLDCPALRDGSSVSITPRAPIYSAARGLVVRDASGASLDGRTATIDSVPRGVPEPRHDLVGAELVEAEEATAHARRAAGPTVATHVPRFGLDDGV